MKNQNETGVHKTQSTKAKNKRKVRSREKLNNKRTQLTTELYCKVSCQKIIFI
jgi:hypothetical protein